MNAATARLIFETLMQKKEALSISVPKAWKWTDENFADCDISKVRTEEPYCGLSWMQVYRQMIGERQQLCALEYEIEEAAFRMTCLEAIEESGRCYIVSGGTDCDRSSFQYVVTQDSLEAALSYRDEAYGSADGVMTVRAWTFAQYQQNKQEVA